MLLSVSSTDGSQTLAPTAQQQCCYREIQHMNSITLNDIKISILPDGHRTSISYTRSDSRCYCIQIFVIFTYSLQVYINFFACKPRGEKEMQMFCVRIQRSLYKASGNLFSKNQNAYLKFSSQPLPLLHIHMCVYTYMDI